MRMREDRTVVSVAEASPVWQHEAEENYCIFATFDREVDTKTSIIQNGARC